jgi:hypothetical protein
LFTDELVLITAIDHALAQCDPITLAVFRLGDVHQPAGPQRVARSARASPRLGRVPPEFRFETTILPRLRELVGRRLRVTLVARSVAEAPGPPVSVHPVYPTPTGRPAGGAVVGEQPSSGPPAVVTRSSPSGRDARPTESRHSVNKIATLNEQNRDTRRRS